MVISKEQQSVLTKVGGYGGAAALVWALSTGFIPTKDTLRAQINEAFDQHYAQMSERFVTKAEFTLLQGKIESIDEKLDSFLNRFEQQERDIRRLDIFRHPDVQRRLLQDALKENYRPINKSR